MKQLLRFIQAAIFLIPGLAIAQLPASAPFLKNFEKYRKQVLQEKLFMHTDRPFYLAGETIWLKLYCVDGTRHYPLDVSRVAYVEVLDHQSKAVLQGKIELLEDGNGSGTLFLPVTLATGNYAIRAYTNWMKNFSTGVFFEEMISVVNPFVHMDPSAPADGKEAYDVQFFPEGGNLVNGVASVVGFRAVGQNGQSLDFKGAILNERNDTLVRTKPAQFGIGRFTFTPEKGHTYQAVVTDPKGQKHVYRLPASFDDGLVMTLSDEGERLSLAVKSSNDKSGQTVYLVAHSRLMISKLETHSLSSGRTAFTIDKNQLQDGVTHFTVFNENGVPVCERLWFKRPTDELTIQTGLQSTVYATRKKIEFDITTTQAQGTSEANLSLSVYRTDALDRPVNNIQHYLMLTSEVNGVIESPGYYFEKENTPERREATDNLMLTHGWSRYRWEDMLKESNTFAWIPEHNGHIISGMIVTESTKAPAAGIPVYLTASGLYTRPYVARSNSAGKLFFEMQNFYGNNEIVAQTNWELDSIYRMEILNPFSEKPSNLILPDIKLDIPARNSAEQRSIHMQVQNIFHKNERAIFRKPQFDSAAFYGIPDEKYRLDDYTRFPTMEEVMREYVRGVQVRKHRDGFHFMNFDIVNHTYFDKDPFVMLDGVPLFDIDKIMTFDPKLIKSVEVMSRRSYAGVGVFDGIVSYRTYRGDLAGFQPDARSLIMSYDGLQRYREFFSPRYESPQQIESTVADTRNLLYWSPSIATGKDGKSHVTFYTSDVTGKYKIIVQGLSKDGLAGYSATTFDVRNGGL